MGPDKFQWINSIGTRCPIGEHVFGVGLPHRLIHRVVLCRSGGLASIGESLEKETIDPLVDQQHLYLVARPTTPDIERVGGFRMGCRSRGE
jgi:hypothetical protein